MAIPTYDQLLRPVLLLATREPIKRRPTAVAMADLHKLTAEERESRLPSGNSTYIRNRTGWAMTFLTKAGLIEKVAPGTYRATERAAAFLAQHPNGFGERDLRSIPGYREAWEAGSAKRRAKATDRDDEEVNVDPTSTPHEIIEREVSALEAELRGRLLQTIVDQTPIFFQRLVLDVLTAMGYGGSREDAAKHVGKSGDEGIDGKINQDALGLDQVLVQAKKYRPDRSVDRKEVQAFFGSLSGQGVTKGVFITTSSFAASAHEFVTRGIATKVVLVDGEMLIELMLRHGIGVRVTQEFKIHEIDQNYFDEEE